MGRYGSDEEQGSRQATEVGQSEKASSDTYVSLLRQGDNSILVAQTFKNAWKNEKDIRQ